MEPGARRHPLVSVVTATYNRWPMVRDTIGSALNQSFRDFEVIVVDDGSPDGSADLIEHHYPEVRVVRQGNTERGKAYNHGVMVARGEYVAFLDDDDVYEPWHLSEFIVARTQHPCGQVFATRARLWDPATGRCESVPAFNPKTLPQDCLRQTIIVPQAMVVAKQALLAVGGFPEERAVMGSEDWLLLIALARRFEVFPLARPSVRIRLHRGRSVNNLAAISASRQVATEKLLGEEYAWIGLDDTERRMVTAGTERFVAGHLYASGQMAAARDHLRSARRATGGLRGYCGTARLWAQTWLGPRGSVVARGMKRRFTLR
jgi:glycosyltransferase involved in cell wall biosynthesis